MKEILFEKSFASNPKSKFWSYKNELKSYQVRKSSSKKFWFDCDKCNHDFEMSPNSITNKEYWCIYCSNSQLCENEECRDCFNKSFASHKKSILWSNKNQLNARQVFKSSHKKYIFNCNVCNHEYEVRLNNITNVCLYCVVPSKILCEDNNCKICFNKSFACNEKSKFWDKSNKLSPRNVFKNSQKIYKFDCKVCNHIFETKLSIITQFDTWCPYCSHQKLCEDKNCIDCFNNSFASHEKSKYWSDNTCNPRDVFKASVNKYIFNCNICKNEFKIKLNHISSSNQWCTCIVNKTEALVYQYLKNYKIKKQFKADWCKNKNNLPFDFLLVDKNIIIELDGRQHFQQVSNWNNPEETLKTDVYKMKCAIEKNYTIIRIQQELVFNNKIDWKSILQNYIEKEYTIPSVIFIGDNRYENHIIEITKLNIHILKINLLIYY